MFKVTGSKAQITRGDTGYLTVSVTDDITDEQYFIKPQDTLTLTVRKSAKSSQILMQKVVTGVDTFYFESQDTNSFKFGKYVYDIQLDTADGGVYTVIDVSEFKIMEEVTY